MRNKLILLVLVIAAVLTFGAVAGSSNGGDRTSDVVGYNVLAERVFEGYVQTKPYVVDYMVYFPMRTMAGTLVQVHLGPKDFIEQTNFKLSARERVTVIGMPTVINGRDVVLAREIRGTSGILRIRDS